MGRGIVTMGAMALAVLATTAAAQERPADGWTVSAGAALIDVPRYEGADRQRTLLVPVIGARNAQGVFLDPVRGLGIERGIAQGVRASAALAIDLTRRREDDAPRFRGLGDIGMAPALRLGIEASPGPAFVKAMLSARLAGADSRGATLLTEAGYQFVRGPQGFLGAGIEAKFMDGARARNFFAVSAAQSAASGLPVHAAGAGLESTGVFLQGGMPLSREAPAWNLFGRLAYTTLRGDAGDSPIVAERSRPRLLLAATRDW